MHFVTHFTIALISLFAIVFSCILFTNAIEFLGNKLKLGHNATGSILAVLGTGLPEFVVPLVAIFGAKFSGMKLEIANEIALGAILGSPFMLSTLALFLLSIVLIIQKRKKLNVDISFVLRDYKYFLMAYFIAILFSFKFLNEFKFIAVFVLIALYILFVCRTILKSRCACTECECEKLYFKFKNENVALILQLLFSALILVFSSHYFVFEIKYFSFALGIAPAILALLIAPFATELPECINSLIWLKQGKDDLALANILGAIVFQTTLLFAMGIILTPWVFNEILLVNVILTILCALFFAILTLKNNIIKIPALIICGFAYFIYLIFVFLK